MSSSTTTASRATASRRISSFFFRLRRTSAYAPPPPTTATAPRAISPPTGAPWSAPVVPQEAGALPRTCVSAWSTKLSSCVFASTGAPVFTASVRLRTALRGMTVLSAPASKPSPSRIAYSPVIPVSARTAPSTLSAGNSAVAGSTATNTGLPASLIFFARPSAWALDSCASAPGAT